MKFDDREVSRLATYFHLLVLLLAPVFIIAGIIFFMTGQTWAWVVIVTNVVIFVIFIPLYIHARRRLKKLE